MAHAGGSEERPALFFDDADDFWAWLAEHHDSASELWMGLTKKHVESRGLTWEQAVPVALCWGWIDSVAQRIDGDHTRQRWTPRKSSSTWSRVNVAHVQRLIAEDRMQPSGLAAWERRSEDRTGIYSFEQDAQSLPDDYAALLAADRAASAFWDQATPGYRKICTHWVLSAKQQATRERRMAQLVECCAGGVLIPSQRYGAQPAWVARAAAAAASAR